MTRNTSTTPASADLPSRLREALRRAFTQFLALPSAVVVAFVALAVVGYWADTAWSKGHVPTGFNWLGELLGDSQSLATLLSTIASSIITVTSITFSLLLIALQQGSSALTTQVTDQFLMRRMNQFYFGYFVGLSVFVLISLVTASGIHRPVFGTAVALILTAAALCMIVVMIYNTIDQMRPKQIVRAIQRHVLHARENQLPLLRETRRTPRPGFSSLVTLRSKQSGYIVGVDAARLHAAMASFEGTEVQLLVPLGRYLAYNERVAIVRAADPARVSSETVAKIQEAVFATFTFDDDRSLKHDASYGIGQLSDIGWTSVSTAKSNPNPGQSVIESLRDILSRWSEVGEIAGDAASLVVLPDAAPQEAIKALQYLIVVTSESMQSQTLAETLWTAAMLIEDMPHAWAARLADVVSRALSTLGEHVLTRDLEEAIEGTRLALAGRGFAKEADEVDRATRSFATTLGVLNSRSTRVPSKA